MKTKEWLNPNHMLINTGHKTFDKQCECLSTGNVYGTCQYSSFIRPRTATECNGFSNPEGHLRDFDLQHFRDGLRSWPYVLQCILEATETQQCILYEIRSWTHDRRSFHANKRKIIHGYILTDTNHKRIKVFITGRSWKSTQIMGVVQEYVSNP